MANTDLAVSPNSYGAMTVQEAVARRNMLIDFTRQCMEKGTDYGTIPGTGKDTLYKPGAEKLMTLYGLTPRPELMERIMDWTGADHSGEPMFYYRYKYGLYKGDRLIAEAEGSCNSWEGKYRYRWVSEEAAKLIPGYEALPKRGGAKSVFEPSFAIEKAETTGKYGKPESYWQAFTDAIRDRTATAGRKKMGKGEYDGWFLTVDETQYRVPNPDIFDTINTVEKMSQKRAIISAVLLAVNASEFFTVDLEDFADKSVQPADQYEHAAEEASQDTGERRPPPDRDEVRQAAAAEATRRTQPVQQAAEEDPIVGRRRRALLTYKAHFLPTVLPVPGLDANGKPVAESGNKIHLGRTFAAMSEQDLETVEIFMADPNAPVKPKPQDDPAALPADSSFNPTDAELVADAREHIEGVAA